MGEVRAVERNAAPATSSATSLGRALSDRAVARRDRGRAWHRAWDRRPTHHAGPREPAEAARATMNMFDRPFAERLQAEAAQIPLPPRDRWTPHERSRPRLLRAVATLAVLALVFLVIGPVAAEQWRIRDSGVAPTSSEQSVAGAPPSTCAPMRDRVRPACL